MHCSPHRDISLMHFGNEAPVGNSHNHLNLRKLTAGDSLSLQENDLLLYTFTAFHDMFVMSYSTTSSKSVKIISGNALTSILCKGYNRSLQYTRRFYLIFISPLLSDSPPRIRSRPRFCIIAVMEGSKSIDPVAECCELQYMAASPGFQACTVRRKGDRRALPVIQRSFHKR